MKKNDEIVQILNRKINTKSILIFDLDGTLANSDYANLLSYKNAIQQVVNLKLDLSNYHNERFTRKTLKKIIPSLSQMKYEKIIRLKNKIYTKYLDKTVLNTLTTEILKKYSKTNKIILVTNSHKKRAHMILKHHGLINRFDHTFYREDRDNGEEINKFKYVLTHLKISPTSVVIFENEKSEVDTAILAGIPEENIICI